MRNTLIAALFALFVSNAFAAGASLITSTVAKEALSSTEAAKIAKYRAAVETRNTSAVALNRNAIDSGLISLTIDGKSYEIVGKREPAENGMSRWLGTGANGARATLYLDTKTGELGGLIRIEKRTFLLRDLGRYHALVEFDHTRPFTEAGGEGEAPKPAPLPTPSPTMKPLAAGDPTIRILHGYTPAALSALGISGLNALVADSMSGLNDSFVQSGVNLNVVSAGLTQYDGTGDTNQTIAAQRTRIPTNLPMLLIRDAVNADTIVIFTYVLSDVEGAVVENYAPAARSAAMVQGYSDRRVYMHEFGHLLGTRHQGDPSNTPYAAGHAYLAYKDFASGQDVCYRTLTSTPPATFPSYCNNNITPGVEWREVWSNPAISHRLVVSGAMPYNNEASVLNVTGPIVANYRFTKIGQPIAAAAILSFGALD